MPKIKNINLNLMVIFVACGSITACSVSTPNDVSMSIESGVCVTANSSGYEATATYSGTTMLSNGYPINASLPANSPYCMAVTLTNNNAGQNSNNVQVYQGGLQLSYNVGGVSYSSYMIDFNASGIPQSRYSYGPPVQQLGNVALFDPQNCVTTIGAHVNTLNKGGGKCTFYLEIVGESLPVGVYPINLSVNYTNGNANYFATESFNQRVNMYVGGDFTAPSSNLALVNNLVNNNATSLPSNFAGNAVQQLTTDSYGNIFAYDGASTYIFNGNIWKPIAVPNGVSSINQLSSDSNGNIFAATNYGLWVYNANNQNGWVNIAVGGSYSAVQALGVAGSSSETIYATSGVNLQSCNWQSSGSCALTNVVSAGNNFNTSSLAVESSVLQYMGIGSQIWQNSNSVLSQLTYANNTYVFGNQVGSLLLDSQNILYAGFANVDLVGPAVLSNSSTSPTVESALYSMQGNYVAGKANGIALRAMNYGGVVSANVVAFGDENSLYSSDFTPASPLVYLLVGYNSSANPVASTNWTPITGINGKVKSVTFGSALTTY